jgi:hypothetical protein
LVDTGNFSSMSLSNTRFIRIDGTHVELSASDDSEARIALKELRHKKKELLHYKRRLVRRRKAIELRHQREVRIGTSPEMSPSSYVLRSLGAVLALIIGWNPFLPAQLPHTLDAVKEDLNTLEEVLLNVDEATLHVQGKLA